MRIWEGMEVDNHRNCMENCIYNISKFFNVPFYPIYADKWEFSLEPRRMNGTAILQSVVTELEDDYFGCYHARCGVKRNSIYNLKETNDGYLLCEGEKVILARADLYDCDWTPFYRKLHYPHYFFIQYVKENDIGVSDPFYNKVFFVLKDTRIVDGLFCFEKEKEIDYNLRKELFSHFLAMKKQEVSLFCMIRRFARWIGAVEDVKDLGEDSVLDNMFLVQRLSYIKSQRYNYSKVLFESKLIKPAEDMEKIVKDWTQVCLLLIKAIATKRNTLCSKMEEILLNIADKEEKLFMELSSLELG